MENKSIEPKQVDKILHALSESSVEELVIENDNCGIHIVRDMSAVSIAKKVEQIFDNVVKTSIDEKAIEQKDMLEEADINYNDILSPEVGIFLRSADDKSQILVKLRDEIKKGQILAYIKSTGILYELKSEYDGKITEILVEDGQSVEFAQPLFRLK